MNLENPGLKHRGNFVPEGSNNLHQSGYRYIHMFTMTIAPVLQPGVTCEIPKMSTGFSPTNLLTPQSETSFLLSPAKTR